MRGSHSGRRGSLIGVGLVVLVTSLIAPSVSAQIATGSINGLVKDDTGGALPGVSITARNLATGQTRTVVTNESGRYQVTGLQPTRYSVTAEMPGFATVLRPELTVNVGSAIDVDINMKIAAVSETVTVTGAAPLVEGTKTDLSSIVTQQDLENLPSKQKAYLDFVLLLPATVESVAAVQGTGAVIGGARSKEGTLLVDGVYNLDEGFTMPKQRQSQDTIQEFQLVTFGGAAEYGRAIGGTINAVTKSGTNELHGSGYGYFRNAALNAEPEDLRLSGVPKSAIDYFRQQWGATGGGPLKLNKAFFFGAFERVNENWPLSSLITPASAAAIGLPPEESGPQPRFLKTWYGFGKFDYNISGNQRLQGSFSFTRYADHQICCLQTRTARSVPYQLFSDDYAALFNWSNVTANGHMFHEAKVSYFPRFYGTRSLQLGGPPLVPEGQINDGLESNASPPRVSISSVATFGSGSLNNRINTYPVQAIYTSSLFANKHTLKFGADYMYAYYGYNQYNPLVGSYTFSSLANFLRGAYTQYTQSFGAIANNRIHQYISGFIQDQWKTNNRLTMNYGLRYDLELNPTQEASGVPYGNDYNNVGPRFAFSYDLTEKGTTFLKVTSGVYYDRIWNNATNNLYSLKDHVTRTSYTWTPTSPGAPVYPAVFATPPANLPGALLNVIIMPSEVRVPVSAQLIARLDHQLTREIAISASGIYTKSWNKETSFDTNLDVARGPVSGAFLRLDPNYRAITQTRYIGPAEYEGAIVEIAKRGTRFGVNGSITVSRALQVPTGTPNDPVRGIRAEYGRAADNPTARVVTSGWFNIAPSIQVSSNLTAHSGRAVNPVAAGLDLNGDGILGDITPGFKPFEINAPGMLQWDARLTWAVPVGGAIKTGGNQQKLHFYLECYNLLNRVNVRTTDNNYGPTNGQPLVTFMTPTSYFPPREVQLGVRLVF